VLTIDAGTIRHPEKLTRCRFAAGEAITELGTGEYAFRSCFTSPFFTEIEFSVGTVSVGVGYWLSIPMIFDLRRRCPSGVVS